MFYCKIPFIYEDFQNENLCFLNLYSVHVEKKLNVSLGVMLSPPK